MKITTIVSYVSIIIITIFVALLVPKIEFNKSVYCHTEFNVVKTGLNVSECMKMAIVTKSMDLIDFDRLFDVNVTCSERYKNLPECEGEFKYYSEYMLDGFCTTDDCSIEGKMCFESYVTYYDDDLRFMYENRYLEQWYDLDKGLSKKVRKCKGGR